MDRQQANASLVIAIPVVLIAIWGTFIVGPEFVSLVQGYGSYQTAWAYYVQYGSMFMAWGFMPFQMAVVPFLQFLSGFMVASIAIAYYADTLPKGLVITLFVLAIAFLCFYIGFFVVAGSGDADMTNMALGFTYFSAEFPPVCLFLCGACFAGARCYL